MTLRQTALICDQVFDGSALISGQAVVVEGADVIAVCPVKDVAKDADKVNLGAGILTPGFVDLQVNGGGGVMFNARQDVETLKTIVEAHARLGATSILPTLITDTRDITRAAIAAGIAAWNARLPGFIGLHLEGPHLDPVRKGAHDPSLIRKMDDEDLTMLCEAARVLPVLMVTVAPENTTPDQIATLTNAGVIVSLGHTDATYDSCVQSVKAGARCVTHLFNAMRQLGNREPGVVGAALDLGEVCAGLICDGLHVHPAVMRTALRAKKGPGQVFLVSDAMAVAGTDLDRFTLNGREILRRDGRLTLADGTLAGADLDIPTAVRFAHEKVGVDLAQALAMATRIPADLINTKHVGRLQAGAEANLVHLSPELKLNSVWHQGVAL
ncbi:N-acetylglucosamine-6-phosphate deacetylase [Cochlodiniinecator piscidefendens]|uniref:N-acetylglucosamine-6-phosphate deacetylase n=1 Tax=Cochlodiniinecator piscidefendens TaxID=2715756 RepID=UPI0014097935|nr:N-acetylglucosamine-6-phosphate deacetylase [Cochlodiniinecator piscidefendens]